MKFGARHRMYIAKLRRNRTAAEDEFCRTLDALGLAYRFQQTFAYPVYRIADFFFPDRNLIVEIDGPYHDAEKDREKDAIFERVRGIKTVRLTNEQAMNEDYTLCGILCGRIGKEAKEANPASFVFNNLPVSNGR